MFIIYGIKNCDSCRKATKHFANNAKLQDIREIPLSSELLERFLAKFGDKLLNHKSKTWKTLSAQDKNLKSLDLLKKFPIIIKRPIIINLKTDYISIGWNDEIKKIHDNF